MVICLAYDIRADGLREEIIKLLNAHRDKLNGNFLPQGQGWALLKDWPLNDQGDLWVQIEKFDLDTPDKIIRQRIIDVEVVFTEIEKIDFAI